MLLSVLSDSESRQRDDMWRHLLSLNRTLKVSCYVRHSVVCPTWQIMSYHTRHCHIMQHYCNAQNGRLQALPTDIKRAATLLTFKKKLETFLFSKHLCWFYCILSSPFSAHCIWSVNSWSSSHVLKLHCMFRWDEIRQPWLEIIKCSFHRGTTCYCWSTLMARYAMIMWLPTSVRCLSCMWSYLEN